MMTLEKIRSRIFGADPDAVAAYQSVLPHNIQVSLKRDGEYIIARIDKVDSTKLDKSLLITEAKDMESLVSSVNDLLYTYVNMPLNIRPYYGDVFKPEGYKPQKAKTPQELILVKS